MVGVHREVTRVNVVALEHHLQNLGLMHGTFLHQVQNLILLSNGVVRVAPDGRNCGVMVVEMSIRKAAERNKKAIIFRTKDNKAP